MEPLAACRLNKALQADALEHGAHVARRRDDLRKSEPLAGIEVEYHLIGRIVLSTRAPQG
jgi:hypothetical protein